MKTRLLLLALVVFAFALAGCTLEGGVEQGRAVAFESGKSLTLVLDTIRNAKTKKTSYTGKIETYALPDEKKDMGPEPTLGNLLAVDPAKGSVIVFDRRVGVRELAVNVTDKESIDNNRNPKVAGKKFPIIDKSQGTVTVYLPGQKLLVTFSPSPEDMEMGDDTWKFGDEMRVAFMNTNKNKAVRVMNVTKTNIFRR